MKVSWYLVSLIACTLGTGHAAISFPESLNAGTHSITFNELGTTTFFEKQIKFSLSDSARVTGKVSAADGLISLISVTANTYTFDNGSSTITATIENPAEFDLGELFGTELIGAHSNSYTLSFSGFKPSNVTDIQLSLNVTPVPEPSTFAMLSIGLIGLHRIKNYRSTLKHKEQSH